MNIFNQLKDDIIQTVQNNFTNIESELVNIEIPKDQLNGDLSSNIAMIIAAKEGSNAREVAIKLKEQMANIPYIAHLEVAGPGFMNFTIRANIWHNSIQQILVEDENFVKIDIGKGKKVNIEYVSANPTGPIHIAHARGAVYGDALARLLENCGYVVTKEYYINDSGSQVETLVQTVILRYKEALSKEKIEIPQGLYPGEYLIDIGQQLVAKFDSQLLDKSEEERNSIVKEFTIAKILTMIKEDLKQLGIEHDVFFSEQSLHDSGQVDAVIQRLNQLGLIYEGTVPAPRRADQNWEERKQLLLKSTNFGDSQDRPIQKADGSWSYLAPDLAYVQNKIDRGFDHLVYVLGADHSSYIARAINAITRILGEGKVTSDVKIYQIVNFIENGVPVKMSKRRGNFTTTKDVINEVGAGILRFIMLTRKNDIVLDFDLVKVKEKSKENPVFYVQYAHVRTVSILTNSASQLPLAYEKLLAKQFDLSLLSSEEEIQLIRLLATWPKMLEGAAKNSEPHRIAFYLLSLAAKFHALWNLGKENNDYRFLIEDDLELTSARLALVKAIQKIIANGLEIIGVQPMQRM